MSAASSVEAKTFDKPDETRQFAGNGVIDLVSVGGRVVARGTFEPGWRWSANVKPIAGTSSCETFHLGYCLQGRMRIRMDDGAEQEVTEGMAVAIAPGHDAEVIGDAPCVLLDFGEISEYARS